MSSIRHLSNTSGSTLNSGDIITTLTNQGQLFLFSYSPALKSLLAWSDNGKALLGAKDLSIARDANLFMRYVHPEDKFPLLTQFERALRDKTPLRMSYRWIRPDNNELRWLHCRGQITTKNQEELFEGLIIDLTDEFQARGDTASALPASASIIDAMPMLLFVLDRDLRILHLNFGERAGFNFGDAQFNFSVFKTGRLFLDCFRDELQKKQLENRLQEILSGQIPRHEARFGEELAVHKLSLLPLVDKENTIGVLGIISNEREVLRLEKELVGLQKVSGLRELSTATGHYLNNCLQSVIGQANLITMEAGNNDRVSDAAQTIVDLVGRAADLSREIFDLKEEFQPEMKLVDVNLQVMAAAGKEKEFSSGVKTGVVFGNVPKVQAKEADVERIISTLLRSALNTLLADPAQSSLSIKTSETRIEEGSDSGLCPGSYVRISIAANSKVVAGSAGKQKKAGDLREQPGELGAILEIVKKLGGTINVGRNISSSGTEEKLTFSLLLPGIERKERLSKDLEIDLISKPNVLLIDDDSSVRETTKNVLSGLGYEALAAGSYAEALTYAKLYHSSLRVVLLDLLMPGMDGFGVLKRLHKIKPSLKVLGFTGAASSETENLLKAGVTQVLMKPVTPEALKTTLSRLIT